jgi:hypothetical protein
MKTSVVSQGPSYRLTTMSRRQFTRLAASFAATGFLQDISIPAQVEATAQLPYSPAPPDNPLTGFAPYAGQARDFPHSLEFRYIPFGDLMKGPDTFDFGLIEQLLKETSSRGCQAIFRVYAQYQDKTDGVSQFLIKQGVKVFDMEPPGQNGQPPGHYVVPDYTSPQLIGAMVACIGELGRRYDGDVRIGFITAGFLGNWGEWHTYPFDNLWASKAVQIRIMDAYQAAFHKTPILVRYPAGSNNPSYAPNANRPFGYHDDSFCWATLPTGRPQDNWFFMAKMQAAGKEAIEKWRTCPVGGEVRPEVWAGLWNDPSSAPAGQQFLQCVEQTHATWMMDSSIARKLSPAQRERAIVGERRMGYEFQVLAANLSPARKHSSRTLSVTVANRGVAPFYVGWPVELQAIDATGKTAALWHHGWKLTGILPGKKPAQWTTTINTAGLPTGAYRLLVGVPNPMPGGRPVRFANRAQDQDLPGWLTVAQLAL